MERAPVTFQVHGPALRKERMDQGLELGSVAEAAGITASYLSRLETGARTRMRPATYHALRTVLSVTDQRLLAQESQETR